jgi:hypothetical protein
MDLPFAKEELSLAVAKWKLRALQLQSDPERW